MEVDNLRSWPSLPKECLESIARCGGPQAAASLTSTCTSWRKDLADDLLWRSWHGLPQLRYRTWQSSYGFYASSLRSWLAGREQGAAVVPHAHERWLTSLDMSQTHVLSGSLDTNVKCWDRSRPGTWIHYLRGHTGPVTSVRLAYDGDCGGGRGPGGSGGASTAAPWIRAYSGSRDGTLRCWDLATGACVRAYTLEGGRQWVNTIAVWRPQPQEQQKSQAVACTSTPIVRPEGWPQAAPDGGSIHSRFGALGGAMHGAIGAASSLSHPGSTSPYISAASPMAVVCGTSIGQLCLYDVRQANPAQRILDFGQGPPRGAVYGVALYGDALATACANGCIYVWDLRAGAVRHKLDEHDSACTCVAMYGDTLVAGDLEGSVYLWSTHASGIRFRGAVAPPAAATRQGATACARAASAAAGGAATAAVRIPQGPTWLKWRPHRRLPGLFDARGRPDSRNSCSNSSSSSSDSDNEGKPRRRCRNWRKDGAAAVATLEALAEGRAFPAAPLPGGRPPPSRQGQMPSPLPSLWLRDRMTLTVGRGAAAAALAAGDAGVDMALGTVDGASAAARAGARGDGGGGDPPPRLQATMRYSEWVRDVALVGPSLVLSCSKDGLVCLSRMDSMQVVAVWDMAAAGSVALADGSTAAAAGMGSPRGGSGGSGGSGPLQDGSSGAVGSSAPAGRVCNQVHALAADEWGFVAGCQDASLRMWCFAPGGILPEVWAPSRNDADARPVGL